MEEFDAEEIPVEDDGERAVTTQRERRLMPKQPRMPNMQQMMQQVQKMQKDMEALRRS